MSVNFTPTLNVYTDLTPFRYWCQKVLPLVYDDSLSYYELLCKVVDYLNKTMEDVNLSIDDVSKLHTAYEELQAYVNNYFDNLDVQEEINNKLDELVQNGTIEEIFSDEVESILNVAQDAALEAIDNIPENVTDWLEEHIIQETGYVIDDTLTVQGAAADAKKTGDEISALKSDLDDIDDKLFSESDNLFNIEDIVRDSVPETLGSGPDVFVTLANWTTSNYIPVTAGEQYALIYNGNITQGAVFRVACYADGVMTYKSAVNEANPYTIPDGVDHIRFFSNTSGLFATVDATSFKQYTSTMTTQWVAYGRTPKYALKEDVYKYGVFVDGNNYYHFVRFGDKDLIRLFKQEGPNNLFQFSGLYVGKVDTNGVTIDSTIATNGTDTVGPISIMRQGIDSGGRFTGGWHTITVNGTVCPTARQTALDITIDGESIIGKGGLHTGKCIVNVTNALYFPQTITGTDLTVDAVQAIEEHVMYVLDEKMTARVTHTYVADTRVILYYGMQTIRVGFDKGILPNNEMAIDFSSMSANVNLDKPENLIQISNADWIYDILLKPYGLAQYTHNPGTGSTKYGYLPVSTRKIYSVLIEGTYDYSYITQGKVLTWEGEWNIYPR